jgi:hypothetical protein
MTNAGRRRIARIIIPLMLLPLSPFAGAAWIARGMADWIEGWQWPERYLALVERVNLWRLQ